MKNTIEYVNVKDLKPEKYNPDIRVEAKNLKPLLETMQRDGFWWYRPLIITKDNSIADGHRRHAAASHLGIEKVPCLRVDKNPQKLWCDLNGSSMPINNKQLIIAVAKGLKELPSNAAGKKTQRIIDKYGPDIIKYLYQRKVSYSTVQYAEKTGCYIGRESVDEIMKILTWIVELKQFRLLRLALDFRTDPDILALHIDNNKPLSITIGN